eukprot:Rhum_TRINITY_DN14483_c3_g2::Rhum_TRINITY_DN14483_c3_g2_i1::g.87472::m.87472
MLKSDGDGDRDGCGFPSFSLCCVVCFRLCVREGGGVSCFVFAFTDLGGPLRGPVRRVHLGVPSLAATGTAVVLARRPVRTHRRHAGAPPVRAAAAACDGGPVLRRRVHLQRLPARGAAAAAQRVRRDLCAERQVRGRRHGRVRDAEGAGERRGRRRRVRDVLVLRGGLLLPGRDGRRRRKQLVVRKVEARFELRAVEGVHRAVEGADGLEGCLGRVERRRGHALPQVVERRRAVRHRDGRDGARRVSVWQAPRGQRRARRSRDVRGGRGRRRHVLRRAHAHLKLRLCAAPVRGVRVAAHLREDLAVVQAAVVEVADRIVRLRLRPVLQERATRVLRQQLDRHQLAVHAAAVPEHARGHLLVRVRRQPAQVHALADLPRRQAATGRDHPTGTVLLLRLEPAVAEDPAAPEEVEGRDAHLVGGGDDVVLRPALVHVLQERLQLHVDVAVVAVARVLPLERQLLQPARDDGQRAEGLLAVDGDDVEVAAVEVAHGRVRVVPALELHHHLVLVVLDEGADLLDAPELREDVEYPVQLHGRRQLPQHDEQYARVGAVRGGLLPAGTAVLAAVCGRVAALVPAVVAAHRLLRLQALRRRRQAPAAATRAAPRAGGPAIAPVGHLGLVLSRAVEGADFDDWWRKAWTALVLFLCAFASLV